MRSRTVNRRRFLRGLGGAAIALPFLESLDPGSSAANPPPKRFIVFFTANGTVKDRWRPSGGEFDFELSEILKPLEPHRKDVLILDGIDMESSYHGPGDDAHWSGMGHMLTGTSLIDHGGGVMWGGGISVDQRIAQEISTETRLRSLELAVEEHGGSVTTRMSYLGPDQPIPPEADPRRAYQRLFNRMPPELRRDRKSVLDTVAQDLADLSPSLSAADRHKIDAHFETIRDIEKRLDVHASDSAACSMSAPPAGVADNFVEAGELQTDILVTAIACDMTRVVSLMWSCGVSMTSMTWLGIPTPHHDLSHHPPSDDAAMASLTLINHWYAERFASLLAKLKAVPEGDGTLLDRCAVLWCNELSIGDVHSRRGVPFVLAGSAGGYFKTGRFLDYTSSKGNGVHNDLLTSICNSMDVNTNTFGDPAFCSGPLPRLSG